jgi:hypothetical protein
LNIILYGIPAKAGSPIKSTKCPEQGTYTFQPEFVKDFIAPIERKGFF